MPPKNKNPSVPPTDDATPAEAAAAEATGDTKPIVVAFRGQDFEIPPERFGTARYAMAAASGQDHKLLYELIGPADANRFIALCKPGESFVEPALEFFEAFSKASGQGNS
jgi:hypothetical protein